MGYPKQSSCATAVCLLMAWVVSFSAHASASSLAVSFDVGTTGVGVGAYARESAHFVGHAQVGGVYTDPSFHAGGEGYHMSVRLLSGLVDEDWYPHRDGNLFIAAGLLINGNRFDLRPHGGKGSNYAYATPAGFRFNTVDPYFGIGWGNPLSARHRWSIRVSAGVAYQGTPHVSVGMGSGPYAGMAYAAERSSIRSALGRWHWYPLVRLSVVFDIPLTH